MTLLGKGRRLGPLSPSAQRVFDLVTREPGLTHTQIAERLYITPNNASGLVDTLTGRDLAERRLVTRHGKRDYHYEIYPKADDE